MSNPFTVDEYPLEHRRGPIDLAPYVVELRCSRRPGDAAASSVAMIESLAARLGVAVSFDDLGYVAEFAIVAEDEPDALATASRRWFYLASDLELPEWQITDIAVTSLSRTHAATW